MSGRQAAIFKGDYVVQSTTINGFIVLRVCVTERALQTDRGLLSEPVAELGQMEYQLLKFFTLL